MRSDMLEGRAAWIFEDHFDIDLIVGVEQIKISDPEQLRPHIMTAYEPDFVAKFEPGDMLIGGRNFGYGHPHYPAMIAMRGIGISCVVAESYSPGFKRGEEYNGMILVTCPGITEAVRRWDRLRIHWREGRVEIPHRGVTLDAVPPTDYSQRVADAGGVYAMLRDQARQTTAAPEGA